ncbi:AAA family ATPase [Patulibacter brassicae]|uniref:AAA family ATPase n=1 Tax=Patulibacter brassicae TaxID=1705717 RepID=A0ABU4VFJ7_9ACTN|nr:AAA family ATPase [Patulibacter brassicae]MDX8150597.1 AAA family ATPase [Patulibacter brassicae]
MERVGDRGLLERERELGALATAVDAAAAGDGRALLVLAGAGLGKTALTDATAALAASAGLRVLRARGAEVERGFAFGVARQLLEREVRGLDDLEARDAARLGLAALDLEATAAVDPDAAHGLLHGLYWLVASLVERRGPLALVVDDLHWADPPSQRAMLHLARRLDGLGVLLVLAARDEADPELDALRREPAIERLAPVALGPDATTELLQRLAGAPADPGAGAACHRLSGGNPFLIRESVLALRREGRPADEAALTALARSAPEPLRREVMLRVSALGPDAVAVARAAAVLDQDTDLRRLAELAGCSRERAAEAVGRLAGAQVLDGDVAPRFVHPLLRSAVHGDITAVERAVLHERAGRLLLAHGAARSRAAVHLALAEPGADPEVAALLHDAGRDALAKGAPATAAELLGRADAEPPPAARRAAVLLDLGRAELALGEPAAAAAHLARGLAACDEPAGRAELAVHLGRALVEAEGPDAAVRALDAAEEGLDEAGAMRVAVERTTLAFFVPDRVAEARRALERHARLPGTAPVQRVALANAALALAFDPEERAATARTLARRALGDGALAAAIGTESPAWGQACYAAAFAEDLDTVERESHGAVDEGRRRGAPLALVAGHLGLAMVRLARGELAGAVAAGDAVLAAAPELPATVVVRRWVTSGVRSLAEALVAGGDLGRADAVVAAQEDEDDGDQPELDRALVRYARAVVAEGAGDHDRAWHEARRFGAVCAAAGYLERPSPWRLVAARAAHARDDADAARSLAAEELALARRWGAPGALAAALRTTALVDGSVDRTAVLEEARALLDGGPLALERARVLVDLGVAHRRAGRRRDAREALEAGMDLAARCGALPLAGAARAELLVLGARPRRYWATGAQSLTATQLRIAELVAQGLTNRQIAQAAFISQKTAETHVSAVLRKLGVRSRHEVGARLAAELQPARAAAAD